MDIRHIKGQSPQIPSTEDIQRNFSGAAEYAQLYEGSDSCARFFNERLRIVLEVAGTLRGGKVLDVGCGPGILLSRMARNNLELVGLDCCPEMITEAKKRTAWTNVKLVVGRIQELPFEDETFDAVSALGVLEYLPDVIEGLDEIARVTKPNRLIVVSMLNAFSVYRSWERFVYSSSCNSWLQRHLWKNGKSLLRLHGRKTLMTMMKARCLDLVKVNYFDVNVCVPPFDLEYPEGATMLNRWIEAHSGGWSSPLVHTAFILTALRSANLARAA